MNGLQAEVNTMNPNAVALTETARQLHAAGNTEAASACLNAALQLAPAYLEAHNLRETHSLPGYMSGWTGVNAQISPQDDIFRFFATHPTSINPVRDYLADGWRTLSELMWLLETHDLSLAKVSSFLEFACGFGRFTRHLTARLPKGAVHVSEIVPEAMAFLPTRFPVVPHPSAHTPEAFAAPGQFDVVFVLSLFSHLPQTTWTGWLRCLWEAVAPGGVLIFSTHGEFCATAAKAQMDVDGFAFFSGSESTTLEDIEYGMTYTSQAYVARVVREQAATAIHTCVPAYFWSAQDAHVLRRPK
jgi:SAM-dependent methyltransferase